jgi:flagellar biosynthetic protein FliR
MTNAVNAVLENADYFLLMLVRTGGLVYASPIFGRVLVPSQVKLCLTLALSYFFFTVAPPTAANALSYSTLIGYFLVIASEILIGVSLAFVTNVFFALTSVAGHSIDMQIGFGMVNVYDVQNRTQAPVTANLLNITLILVFMLTDGHLRLIDILYTTFEHMPVGVPLFSPNVGITALEVFSKMFALGVMVALPVIASGLMIEICFGALMRAVPQIHMMVVGIPLKLIAGFIMILSLMPVYVHFSHAMFDELFRWIEMMFSTIAGV